MSNKKYMSVGEVAKILGFCEKTVYRKIWGGEIPAKQIGRRIRIEVEAFENYMNGLDIKVV
jgi:excisionase family DNA binding protein